MRNTLLSLASITVCLMLISVPLSAQTRISGPLGGTLGPGTYIVEGDIVVPADSVLRIMPGTEFQHIGPYVWEIFGRMNADGALGDSIMFIRQNPVNEHRWRGIRFYMGASDSSSLDYCVIDHCYHSYMSFMGGGLYVEGITLAVTNSRVSFCEGFPDGGGILAFNAFLTVDNCIIADNSALEMGNAGGICFWMCPGGSITNSIVARNRATSN